MLLLAYFFGELDALFFSLPSLVRLLFTKINRLSHLLLRQPQLLLQIVDFLVELLRRGYGGNTC